MRPKRGTLSHPSNNTGQERALNDAIGPKLTRVCHQKRTTRTTFRRRALCGLNLGVASTLNI